MVTKLKAGVLSLKVETGRFKGSNPALRVCDICDSGETEDEMHYLYHCKGLAEVRKPYIEEMRTFIPDYDKVTEENRTKIILSAQHIKFAAKWFDAMYTGHFDKLNQKV